MNDQQQTALDILNENGWVNIPFLQRKMKVSYQEAAKLCVWLSDCENVRSDELKTHIEIY